MIHKRILLSFIAVFVIVPTTLVAMFLTWLVLAAFLGGGFSSREGQALPAIVDCLLVVGGWFGIITLWRLYFHFRRVLTAPHFALIHLLGLASGSVVSIVLLTVAGVASTFTMLFFGWPLIAAVVLGYLLVKAPTAT